MIIRIGPGIIGCWIAALMLAVFMSGRRELITHYVLRYDDGTMVFCAETS